MEVACNAVALREGTLAFLCFDSASSVTDRCRSLTRAPTKRRQGSRRDIELRAQRLVVDRLAEERPELVRSERDRGAGGNRDGGVAPGGPKRSAAQISAGKTR